VQRNTCLLALVVLLLCTVSAGAATIHVPADQPTIQAGINAAVSGDVVLVDPGTYAENLRNSGKAITIRSTTGPEFTTLLANVGTNLIISFAPDTFRLEGFQLRNNSDRGIISEEGVFVVSNCWFTHFSARSLHISYSGTQAFLRSCRWLAHRPTDAVSGLLADNLAQLSVNRCVFYGLSASAVEMASGVLSFTSNTLVQCDGGVSIETPLVSGQVYNNIFYDIAGAAYETASATPAHDYNLYYHNGGEPPEAHAVFADPLLQDTSALDFQPLPYSPCVDAGNPDPQYDDPDGTRSDIGAIPCARQLPVATHPNLGQDNAMHVVRHTPTFFWTFLDTVGSQTAYELEVGTDTLWDVAELWSTGPVASPDTSATYTGASLYDGLTYYWRLRLNNGIVWGGWSRSAFRMNSTPSVPVPNRPVAGASARAKGVRLFVNNSADPEVDSLFYDFQIFSDPGLAHLVSRLDGQPQTTSPTGSNSFPPVPAGVQYWWIARAFDRYEYSAWSASETFTAEAGPIRVPADEPAIQAAIDAATCGDTVLVAPGIYVENIDFTGKAVSVFSEAGSAMTTLRPVNPAVATVKIIAGESAGSELRGFTLTGSASNVIQIYGGSTPTLRQNLFIENPVYDVAIKCSESDPLISHNVFVRNGGISCIGIYSGTGRILNNTFDHNARGFFTISNQGVARNNIVSSSSDYGVYGYFTAFDYNDVWNNHPDYEGGAFARAHDISLDPKFRDPGANDYSLTDGSPCINAGDPDPQYNNPDGTRSDMGAFPVFTLRLPAPFGMNLRPDDSSRVVNHTPTFHWTYHDTLGSQTAYELEVGLDTLWDPAEMWSTGQVSSSDSSVMYSGLPLVDGGTYYWRLRVSNGTDWGDWRGAIFHMNSKPSVPTPNAPVAGVRTCPDHLRLYVDISTDPDADRPVYDYQIFEDPALTNVVASQNGVLETGLPTGSEEFSLILIGAEYWWRARAYDGYEYSDWSSAETFTIQPRTLRVPTDAPTPALAIGVACGGDTVLLAHGIYTNGVDPKGKAVVIAGELPAESTIVTSLNSFSPAVTILRGEGPGTIIRDFTITGGSGAGGVLIVGASPQILDNIITQNFSGLQGGGVRIQGGGPVIRGNRIRGNWASSGGGIYVGAGTSAIIDRNVLEGNAAAEGAAIAKYGSGNLVIFGNTIYANNADGIKGGAILTSQQPGEQSHFLIDHNSIVGNSSASGGGAGIVCEYPNGGEITNNIIAFNLGGYGIHACENSGAPPLIRFNDVWWNELGDFHCVLPDSGNIAGDPRFCDTSLRDFRLAADSPCLGTGEDGSTIGALVQGCVNAAPFQPVCSALTIDPPRPTDHVVSHTPVIRWSYADPGSRLLQLSEIQIGTDNDWSAAEMWQPAAIAGPNTSVQYAGLPLTDGSWYHARGRVRNDTLWSDWSEMSFHMNSLPPVPVLLSPAQGGVVKTGRPTLKVQDVTDADGDPPTYTFAVCTDSLLVSIVDSVSLSGTSSWTTDSLTAENARHWWRARACDGFECSPWSSTRSFWVNAYDEPSTGLPLRTPPDGVAVYDLRPTFVWDPVVDPDPGSVFIYILTVSLNPSFTFKQDIMTYLATSFRWPDPLLADATYWWRVHADNIHGDTITSPARSFRLTTAGDENGDGVADVFDVIWLIDYAFAGGPPPNPLSLADVNGDCASDVFDIIYLIDHVFSGGPAPVPGCA